ncbi:hypothetical protein FHL15_004888 [Xylaria flabelliformis]|uniref:Uncharacterized protein n=1 Tax=Xylaria flabelliformis TaxID=2512241 RepID=A0A553I1N7_9PEZI|nr:hypothetical protein FHL15_004888 [Xylaria flabelliformis]
MENERNLRSRVVPNSSAPRIHRGRGRPRKIPRLDNVDVGGVVDSEEDDHHPQHQEGEEEENEGEDEDDDDEHLRPTFRSGKAKRGIKGTGLRSKQWVVNKEKTLEGLSRLPGHLMGIVSEFPDQLADFSEFTRFKIRQTAQPDTVEELLSKIPGPLISETWTQQMEDDLRRRFHDDPLRGYMVTKRPVQKSTMALWRKCCHLRVFPTDIIGAEHYMEYGADVVVGESVSRPNPDWTKQFCDELGILIFGSPCNDNMGLLALLIRYAVACRIDDRRKVPMEDSATELGFFDVMKEQMELSGGSLSLQEIGEKARETWQLRGRAKSWEIQVLENLENMYVPDDEEGDDGEVDGEGEDGEDEDEGEDEGEDEREDEREDEETGFAPYKVLLEDLVALREAFGRVSDLGFPLFANIEMRYKVVAQARPPGGAPKTWADLNRLREALMLKDMRLEEQRRLGVEASGHLGLVPHQRDDSESWGGLSTGKGQDPDLNDPFDEGYKQQDVGEELPAGDEEMEGVDDVEDYDYGPVFSDDMDVDSDSGSTQAPEHPESLPQPQPLPQPLSQSQPWPRPRPRITMRALNGQRVEMDEEEEVVNIAFDNVNRDSDNLFTSTPAISLLTKGRWTASCGGIKKAKCLKIMKDWGKDN